MVASANTGGGIGLFDPNLQNAASQLTWLSEALRLMGSGGDPVVTELQRLDWDKSYVEETIGPIGKIRSSIGNAADDLRKLLERADSSWDGEVYNVFRVIVSGLQKDCELVGHTLEQMRTDVDGDKKGFISKDSAFDVLNRLTGELNTEAANLSDDYAWAANPTAKLLSDPENQNSITQAWHRLRSAVDARVHRVTDVQSCTKRHLSALKLGSG